MPVGGSSVRKDRAPNCIRQAQLAALDDALSRLAGRGALVLVRGPSGSGKSTLLAAAAHGWRRAGVQVVSGRFDHSGEDAGAAAALGFPTILDAFRDHFEEIGDPGLTGPLAAFSRACAGTCETTAAGLIFALGAVIDHLAAARPVALLLDDADAPLAPVPALTGARRSGCLVVAAGQDRHTPASRRLEAEADLVIDLPGLRDDAVAAMLARASGAPVDNALLSALRTALGPLVGNPGTVLATVAALRREGRLAVVGGHLCLIEPHVPIALPEEHWLLTRVRALGTPARYLATMAAISPFAVGDLPLLAEARCADLAEYGRMVDRLVEDGVLTADAGGVHLRCAALGTRLVADAGPVAVGRLHRALAAAMFRRLGQGDKADPARLADHVTFAGSTLPLDERIAVWLADVAAVACADADRMANWLRAALWHAGAGPQAAPIFTRLLRLLIRTGQYRRLAEVVEAARPADGDGGMPDRAQDADITAATMFAAVHLGRPMPAGRTLVEPAGRNNEPGQPLLTQTDVALMTRAVKMQRTPPDPHGRHRPAEWEDQLLVAGSMCDKVTVFELVLGPRYGPPTDGVLAAYTRMVRGYARGEFAEVLSAAREIEASEAPTSCPYRLSLLVAADTHALRGNLDDASTCLAAVPDEPPYRALRAWVACGLAGRVGDSPDAAIRDGWLAYKRQRADGFRIGVEQLLARMAETAQSNHQPRQARAVLSLVEALGRGQHRQVSRQTVRVVRAMVQADPASAEAAVDILRRRGQRLALVQACLAIGRRAPDAAPWLREAYDVAKQWDAPYLRSQINAVMRERGVSAPRVRGRGTVLSRAETQIIELIREGWTNRQIATHLGISEKTVENSLTRLFARTGLRSRVELAVATVGGNLLKAKGGTDVAHHR